MGNKVEKSRLDQSILDKLIEDTGLEREVIIAWRLVKHKYLNRKYDFSFCFYKKTISTGLSVR
jgi:hypothetical protein